MDRRKFLKQAGLSLGTVGAASTGLAAMINNNVEQSPAKPQGHLQAEQASAVKHWQQSTDLLVVGSGAAGISAAIAARESDGEALVLEKFNRLSGSSGMSGGVCYMGGGTPLQKALGFEDSAESMYNFIMKAGRKHQHAIKVQRYCEESLEHFDWMLANGVEYQEKFSAAKGLPGDGSSLYFAGCEHVSPYREIAKPAPRGHVPYKKGMYPWTGGKVLMQALTQSAIAKGVKIQNKTTVQNLVLADDGRVVGVKALTGPANNKQSIYIKARKAVVLAAGGFIHNREMVKHYAPELYDCSVPWGNAGDMGDGILMAMQIGAACSRMDQGFAVLPLYQPEHTLAGIVVNAAGNRYAAEDTYHGVLGHETAFNQHGKAFFIVDKQADFGFKDWRHPPIAKANTIAELEAKIGLAKTSLQHSLEFYNRSAEQGVDLQFGKDKKYLRPLTQGPFTAYDLAPDKAFYAAHTFGGLSTDENNQVLNAYGEAIQGLYAAGRTTQGLPSSPYIASGLSIGDCTFFGRIAGKHAITQGV